MNLRDYQTDCLTILDEKLGLTSGNASSRNRFAVVLPTGTGKTVIFSELTRRYLAARPTKRVLILVHRQELLDQTVAKLRSLDPDMDVGRVKAELDETDHRVIVASVQTLARESRRRRLPAIGVVIFDEAHHSAASTWRKVLDHVGCFDARRTALVGFSATLSHESGDLAKIYQECVFNRPVLWFVRKGYLVDVTCKTVRVDADLDGVKRSRGDFTDASLSEALDTFDTREAIVNAYAEYARDRSGVVFCPSVGMAETLADDFADAGITSAVVTGETPTEVRREIYAAHAAGTIQVLCSCMVLTEGWDAPHTSCCVMARPTSKPALYVQCIGRVLRPSPGTGKRDALVLDLVGVSRKMKLATISDLDPELGEVREDETLSDAAERKQREDREATEKEEIVKRKLKAAGFDDINILGDGESTVRVSLRRGAFLYIEDSTRVIPHPQQGSFTVMARCGSGWLVLSQEGGGLSAQYQGGDESAATVAAIAHVGNIYKVAGLNPPTSKERWRAAGPSINQLSYIRSLWPELDTMAVHTKGDASDLITLGLCREPLHNLLTQVAAMASAA